MHLPYLYWQVEFSS